MRVQESLEGRRLQTTGPPSGLCLPEGVRGGGRHSASPHVPGDAAALLSTPRGFSDGKVPPKHGPPWPLAPCRLPELGHPGAWTLPPPRRSRPSVPSFLCGVALASGPPLDLTASHPPAPSWCPRLALGGAGGGRGVHGVALGLPMDCDPALPHRSALGTHSPHLLLHDAFPRGVWSICPQGLL